MAQVSLTPPRVPSQTGFFTEPDPKDFTAKGLAKWRLTRTWLLFFEQLVKLPFLPGRGNTQIVQLADSQQNFTAGDLLAFDANGNAIDSGVAAPGGWGSGVWFSEIPKGLLNASNKVFTTSYNIGLYPILVANGVVQSPDSDFSFTGNTITYTNNQLDATKNEWHRIWYWRGAKAVGQGRSFNGTSDKLLWGNNNAWDIGGDLTLAFWIKIPSGSLNNTDLGGTLGCVIMYGDASTGGNDSYKVFLSGHDNYWSIAAAHEDVSSNQDSVTIAQGLKSNTWYFIGIVRNATAKTYTGYIGTPGSTATLGAGLSGSYTHTPASPGGVNLSVGYQWNSGIGANLFLNATVEEHYIWSRQLSQAELQQVLRGGPPVNNLVLECLIGNSPEQDLSATAGSGTVTGTTLVTGHP